MPNDHPEIEKEWIEKLSTDRVTKAYINAFDEAINWRKSE